MTHEIKNLIQGYLNASHLGLSCVMATVVDLDGSSYRRPGVRMLINEHGQMTGAVSGGCVEKEILKQAQSVFKTGEPKMMTYDGRYRLGCEGTLYILIEKFSPDSDFLDAFNQHLKKRLPFDIQSYYRRADGVHPALGSVVIFDGQQSYSFEKKKKTNWPGVKDSLLFKQSLKPCFKLMIVGAEHDTAQLSIMASSLGWEVSVVVSPSNPQVISDFPGAIELLKINAVDFPVEEITANVAIVLMSHNYAKDLDYLYVLRESKPAYIGLLGPSDRREKMLNELIEKYPAVNEGLFDLIFGPAGLNIGAETPQEIALSICSEILSVIRGQQPKSLKDKLGSIHLNTKL